MPEGDYELARIIDYMRAHWPGRAKWQISIDEYKVLAGKALAELTTGKTKSREMMRIAGLSGSGKTSQLLPAAEAYFESKNLEPAVVAARVFVKYHPHLAEIMAECGEENLRKETDEFATIMLFMSLKALIIAGYDFVLDVTLLDPKMEEILVQMLEVGNYKSSFLMIAVSPEVTSRFLQKREWRHSEETEKEFVRATKIAMEFYAKRCPKARLVIWNVYGLEPVYDGEFQNGLTMFEKYSNETEIPEHDKDKMREAKINYLKR